MSVDKYERKALLFELSEAVEGDVSIDPFTLGIYSSDASIYQITPIAVVLPRHQRDVEAALRIAVERNIPILPRGGGTSLAGQSTGACLILDFSKYMNQVLELNTADRWVRVQPGVVLDELNAQLAGEGLQFAPDPATSSRATIGGMIGNNSAGTKSIIYGLTQNHVKEITALLADGTLLNLGELSSDHHRPEQAAGNNVRETEIFEGFEAIIARYHDEISEKYPKVIRSVQGYNLDAFLGQEPWNLCELVVGSEGTLCITLEAKLNLVPLPKHKVLCTVHFDDLMQGIRTVAPILQHKPSAVELLDGDVVAMARDNLSIAPMCGFIEGDPKAILIVEFFGESPEEVLEKAESLAADLKGRQLGYSWPIITELAEQAKVWGVRKNGLGLMLGIKGNRKPLPFIEDCAIPIDVLPDYIDEMLTFCRERDISVAMYAHASVGVIHVRPVLDLRDSTDIQHLKEISDYSFQRVMHYHGAWSGEHGDGRVRSPYLEAFFGPDLYQALREVKTLFDPRGLLNPGVIIDPNPLDQDLRYGVAYRSPELETEYHYRQDGSFAGAIEMCTGVGACRQKLVGTMCPSYRATMDEQHSTRGRANALRLAMTGQLGPQGLTDPGLYGVMELCLSCKACKAECPSNVDMARLKSEFLQRYHDQHGFSLRRRMIASSAGLARRFSGLLAPVVNWVQRSWVFKKTMEMVAGIDSRRTLPGYATVTFTKWFDRRVPPASTPGRQVVLFEDTYLNYQETAVGISAVELLESCGYQVILSRAGCCQRPKMSYGMLRDAKAAGLKTLTNLDTFIRQGLKVVVCEPSCASALTDDLPDLIDDEALGRRIKANVMMIDEFLAREIQDGQLTCELTSPFAEVVIHGHCHQKALFGTTAMKQVLDRVAGVEVREFDSGCCGMAGSFGYEKEHYDLSMKIGEDRLFPAVRAREHDSAVVACGFSCRHQIAAGTQTKAIHWVDTLRGKAQGDGQGHDDSRH